VKPFQLMLADAGYDVFIANARGTEYCRGHTTLDAAQDPEYWDWSIIEMGLYDDKAYIELANSLNDKYEKSFYMGYSQGTSQFFYSLAHEEESFHVKNTYKYLALAPCFFGPSSADFDHITNDLQRLVDYDVVALNGPNWERDKKVVKENFDQWTYDWLTNWNGYGDSVKTQIHWG